MYFWNIKKLKSTLIDNELSQINSLKYLLISISPRLLSHLNLSSSFDQVLNNWYISMIFIISILLELLFAFKANNGKSGKDFLGRYLSIRTVMQIRYFCFLYLISILILIIPAIETAYEYGSDINISEILLKIKPYYIYLISYLSMFTMIIILPIKTVLHIRDISHRNSKYKIH